MELEEKVNKAKQGDENAFYELIQERKEILYKTAFIYMKNKEDALEVVQETVYKAYVSIKKLKEPRFFYTWLTRILIHCAYDQIKKNKKEIPMEVERQTQDYFKEEQQEERLDIRIAVEKLEEKYKTIVILKYFQDLTLQQIAEVLDCPLGTVKTNLHKALKELRVDLGEGEME